MSSPAPHREPRARTEILLYLSLVILAAFLRFPQLGRSSLWIDECITAITVERTSLGDALLQRQDYAAPLYMLILRSTSFPRDEQWMRFPAAIAGVATVLAAGALGRSMFGRAAGLCVALIVATNMLQNHYSREARPYTLFTLLSCLSMLAYWRCWRRARIAESPSRGDALFWALSSALLVYAHYYGFWCLFAQAVHSYLTPQSMVAPTTRSGPTVVRGRWWTMERWAAWGFLGIGALIAPAIVLCSRYAMEGTPGMTGWIPAVKPHQTVPWLGELVGMPLFGGLCLVPLFAVVWPGGNGEALDDRSQGARFLCLWWIISGLLLPSVISTTIRPILLLRYALPVGIPMILLGVEFCLRRSLLLTLLVMSFVVASGFWTSVKDRRPVPGLRDVERFLESPDRASSKVVIVDWGYTQGWVNPELWGLRRYGLNREVELAPWWRLNEPSLVPDEKKTWIISFWAKDQVAAMLVRRSRRFEVVDIGPIRLFGVDSFGRRD